MTGGAPCAGEGGRPLGSRGEGGGKPSGTRGERERSTGTRGNSGRPSGNRGESGGRSTGARGDGGRPTGTRPKSSSGSQNSCQSQPRHQTDLANLVWEHQSVKESLATLRQQLDTLDMYNADRSQNQQYLNSSLPKNQTRTDLSSGYSPGLGGEEAVLRSRVELLHKVAELEGRRQEVEQVLGGGRGQELRDLRARLQELESMVAVFGEEGRGEVFSEETSEVGLERSLALLTAQYEKTSREEDEEGGLDKSLDMMPPPMVPLNNSLGGQQGVGESVRLARELRTKRGQLERLMKKNVFNTSGFNTSISSTQGGRQKETNSNRSQETDRIKMDTGRSTTDTGQQLVRLQGQVNKLKGELDRLSGSPQTFSSSSGPVTSGQANQENTNSFPASSNLASSHHQASSRRSSSPLQTSGSTASLQGQVQHLSLSVNQIYQGLWSMQRDVARVNERLLRLEQDASPRDDIQQPDSPESMISSVTRNGNRGDPWTGRNNLVWPGNSHVAPPTTDWLGSGFSQSAPPFANSAPPLPPAINSSPPQWGHQGPTLPTIAPDHHLSPFPPRELWNSLQASPGFNNSLQGVFGHNYPTMERDSGVSSGALNNQVSPGMRANNYYDNFRSYSRQNRLSGSPQVPLTAANLRQQQQQVVNQQPAVVPLLEPVNNLPSGPGGTVRPIRRKHKINREQNRDQQVNNTRRRQSGAEVGEVRGANPVLAVNTYTSPTGPTQHSAVDNLTKNIYSQVGALINQHDRAPEMLARLLADLTQLGSREQEVQLEGLHGEEERRQEQLFLRQSGGLNMNLHTRDRLDTSSFSSTEENFPPGLGGRSKVAGKRLTTGPQSMFPVAVNNAAFDLSSSENNMTGAGVAADFHQTQPSSQIVTDNNILGEVGVGREGASWGQSAPATPWNITPPQLVSSSSTVEGNSGGGVAVPKNQQKNLISRERDSRKMPGWRERLLPRNMQGNQTVEGQGDSIGQAVLAGLPREPDQDGFVNIQLELPGEIGFGGRTEQEMHSSVHQSLSSMAEAELAEADQAHEMVEAEEEEIYQSPVSQERFLPEGVFPVRDSDSPLRPVNYRGSMAGLDRIPTRLPSSQGGDLERRMAEEEAVASIVEEVLASSPELANNQEADFPPQP